MPGGPYTFSQGGVARALSPTGNCLVEGLGISHGNAASAQSRFCPRGAGLELLNHHLWRGSSGARCKWQSAGQAMRPGSTAPKARLLQRDDLLILPTLSHN
ncbi:hypothetical protein CVIRNUC_009389 [Coccomyxa viridis]|uniref:Uncharacterized protein n=1 Tax=Coccomyxa viridis TaxID=1274662 RepID=A0AAV1IH92_9CHLO|nr:hypothetical protein CVIRNUC_009389 [Coccomyxa viridis]